MLTRNSQPYSDATSPLTRGAGRASAVLAVLVVCSATLAEPPRESTFFTASADGSVGRTDAAMVCPFEDEGHCKLGPGKYILTTDRRWNANWADDFRPDGSVISKLCWWPCYLNPTAWEECVDNLPPDDFIVRFYEDAGEMIGAEIGHPGGQSLVPDSKIKNEPPSRRWAYTAPLPTTINVTAGDCYWIEITGYGSADGCTVFTATSDEGNVYSLYDSGMTYGFDDITSFDSTMCIDSGLASSDDCGPLPGACCFCNDSCLDADDGMDREQSAQQTGVFFPGADCNDIDWVPPPNDDCADAVELEYAGGVSEIDISVEFDTRCATTDGHTPFLDCNDGGSPPVGKDVWFTYLVTTAGILNVSLCDDTAFDTVLAVYDGSGTCNCPADPGTQLSCSDDGCGAQTGAGMVEIEVTDGNCYLIRVGGWDGDSGLGKLTLSIGPPNTPGIPTVSLLGLIVLTLLLTVAAKIRYSHRRGTVTHE